MVSVVVCTYNRAESLRRTLQSLAAMALPPAFAWELIVVDNNSKDQTRQVVSDFTTTCAWNVRYVFEERQGIAHARNRGAEEAKGDIVAYVDDDIVVTPNWLQTITRAFSELDADCVGGRILPRWEAAIPTWLTEDLYGYLGLLDYGTRSLRMESPMLWSANYAVKKRLFAQHGKFDVRLGRVADKLYADEETDFNRRLLQGGARLWYCAGAVVYHSVPATRMTKSYFRKWACDAEELRAKMATDSHRKQIAGVPLYPILNVWSAACRYGRTLWHRSEDRFNRELDLCAALGFLRGKLLLRFGKMK